MQKHLILSVIFSFILLGCQPSENKQYFLTHPNALKEVLNECNKSADSGKTDARCQTAFAALEKLEKLIIQMQQSPQGFGEAIIRLQMKIAELEQQLKHLKKTDAKTSDVTDLKAKLSTLKDQYQAHLAIIRMQGV